jgi:genome maintenance exonuclease 1
MQYFNHVKNTSLNIPELKQINSDSGRMYETMEGERFPSITTVLNLYNKNFITEWKSTVGEEYANKVASQAARRGTIIHESVEHYLSNRSVPFVSFRQQELFKSIRPLLNDINNVHCLEQRLFSRHLKIAGTVDCIAEHEGRLSVIDFKTSSRTKEKNKIENYFMQCTAYAIMYEELTGIPIQKIVIIIAVEDDFPQIFIEKRDNFVKSLLHYRELYRVEKHV